VYLVRLVLLVRLDKKASRVLKVHRDREVTKASKDQLVLQDRKVGTVENYVHQRKCYSF